jgi:uncharacterized protein
MIMRIAMIAALAIVLAGAVALLYQRWELRPRPARLDAAATGLPVEAVTIKSGSGAVLAGWFLPASGRGAVLLLHGAKSNRLVLVERMRMLREAGYSTLAIDFQAHGESTGDRITVGDRESLDARSALAWLRERLPGEPVAVLGISMGGAAILIGEPIAADAVIIESAFPDLASAARNRLVEVLGPVGRLLTPIFLATPYWGAGVAASRLRPIDGIGRLHVPIFVITGADDRRTTPEESRALFDRANPPKSYWEVPGAWHVDLAAVGGQAYRDRLLAFLDSTLRDGGTPH